MPCTPGIAVTAPDLPSPLSLTPPDPSVSFDASLCCKLPIVPLGASLSDFVTIPPIILNPAVIAILNALIDKAIVFVNLKPIDCPLE